MAFILPLLAEGAMALGEYGAELLGEYGAEELGEYLTEQGLEKAGEFVGSETGQKILGGAGAAGASYIGNKVFGSFQPNDEEQEANANIGIRADLSNNLPMPLNNIYVPNKPTYPPKRSPDGSLVLPIIPKDEVETTPLGFRLHYTEQKPKVGIYRVPKSETYFPILRKTNGNNQFGNTGGFT